MNPEVTFPHGRQFWGHAPSALNAVEKLSHVKLIRPKLNCLFFLSYNMALDPNLLDATLAEEPIVFRVNTLKQKWNMGNIQHQGPQKNLLSNTNCGGNCADSQWKQQQLQQQQQCQAYGFPSGKLRDMAEEAVKTISHTHTTLPHPPRHKSSSTALLKASTWLPSKSSKKQKDL